MIISRGVGTALGSLEDPIDLASEAPFSILSTHPSITPVLARRHSFRGHIYLFGLRRHTP